MKSEIVVLGMGGTIAGRAQSASDNIGYRAGEVPVDELVHQCLADIAASRDCNFCCEQVTQKDSKDMMFDDWAVLSERVAFHLARAEVLGVVVTHGTDTLEEGAYFLHLTLPSSLQLAKPVVMTCAMRPATSLAPDGPQNLRDAANVVFHEGVKGVSVVCAGEIHAGHLVRKAHTYRMNALESADGAVAGYVEEGRVRWSGGVPLQMGPSAGTYTFNRWPTVWPRVELLHSYANASGDLIRALVRPLEGVLRVDGLVIAGTGNGTLHNALIQGINEAYLQGVSIVITSRCPSGAVLSEAARNRLSGRVDLATASPYQIRIALTLDLLGDPM